MRSCSTQPYRLIVLILLLIVLSIKAIPVVFSEKSARVLNCALIFKFSSRESRAFSVVYSHEGGTKSCARNACTVLLTVLQEVCIVLVGCSHGKDDSNYTCNPWKLLKIKILFKRNLARSACTNIGTAKRDSSSCQSSPAVRRVYQYAAAS